MFYTGEKWYFVGIKGVGMTALVKILQHRGVEIQGSDVDEVFITDEVLKNLEIEVESFDAVLPENCTGIIHSAAFGDENTQIITAKERGIQVLSYTEALGELSRDYFAVGIAGTHGKTTITAWLGYALKHAGADPTVVVGTMVPQFEDQNALVGNSKLLIAETCEYRRHFLSYHPDMLLISNIEMDHPDYFTDIDDMKNAYDAYIERLPEDGVAILHDSIGWMHGAVKGKKGELTTFSYGDAETSKWQLTGRSQKTESQKVTIHNSSKNIDLSLEIFMPGLHNAHNLVGIVAVGYELQKKFGFDWTLFLEGLEGFSGTTRRMEYKGQVGELMVFDDYAHHPTELKTTLKTLRERFSENYIIAAFMPHTFSRTETLFDDFASSFGDVDEVIMMPIYGSAREQGDANALASKLVDAIKTQDVAATFYAEFEEVVEYLNQTFLEPEDKNNSSTNNDEVSTDKEDASKTKHQILITLGAGDNWKLFQMLKDTVL